MLLELSQSMLPAKDISEAPVVEMILQKKTLRNKILYEVHTYRVIF